MTIGSHQKAKTTRRDHFTPRWITDALGPIDTDAATAIKRPWDIGRRSITPEDDTLAMAWGDFGDVFLNPPFDVRTIGLFIAKMVTHNRGVLLLHGRLETGWFKQVWGSASAMLALERRVVFLDHAGAPLRIDNPKSKHYGRVANSGAPVVLLSFGGEHCERLAFCGLDGKFIPLIIPRSVLAMFVGKWREAIEAEFPAGDIHLDEAYRRLCSHPIARRNRNPREKIRQVLNRGGFERVKRGVYRRASA